MNWFDIHPKVKAALIAVALVALASGSAALNGSQSAKDAFLQTATAALATAAAYLKSA